MGMLYGLAYSEAALAYFENVVPKPYRVLIIRRIRALTNDLHPKGAKQLHGVTDGDNPVYRLRQGNYRIIYCVRDGPIIIILDIGHRKDVYRRLP